VTAIRNLRALATATAILAIALTGEARGQAQWQTVTGPDGSFTVEMPGAATHVPAPSKSPRGTPYTLHQYLFQGEGTLYLAQTASIPKTRTYPTASLHWRPCSPTTRKV
jgi:hypothetical protein